MALLLTVFLFVYFALCGRAWLSAFRVKFGHTRNWLLAPSLGVALNILGIVTLNQAGLPVMSFARPFAAVLLMFSLGVALWRRDWRLRGLAPFVALALMALLVGAWPMLRYGFNWVSYGNDDMTNYCLEAQRVLNHGFYRVPQLSELAGTDYSQFYWFLFVAHLIRCGSEALLAEVAATLGRPPVEIFMPVIFALALTQLWSVGALLYSCPRRRIHALLASAFLMVSPLWNYGTLHQLIAQVGGIALLLTTLTLTARTRFPTDWGGRWRQASVISLAVAGIGVTYPEIIPFLVLGVGLYGIIRLARHRQLVPGHLAVALLSMVLVVFMLRHNVISMLTTLLGQTAGGLIREDINLTIFPYFLMPKGISLLFGFDIISASWPEPLSSICIGLGLGALAVVTVAGLRGAFRLQPASCLLLMMLAVGGKLFLGNNSFGLFKLAMFMTPVLFAELAALFIGRWRSWPVRTAALVLCGVWLVLTQEYVKTSTPGPDNVYIEINHASHSRGQMPAGSSALFSDISSSPVAKLAAGAQAGLPIIFLSRPFLKGIFESPSYNPPEWVWQLMPDPEIPRHEKELSRALYRSVFVTKRAFGTFIWPVPIPATPIANVLLTAQPEVNSFNKLSPVAMPAEGLYAQVPMSTLRNHLIFVHSEIGQHYYLGQIGQIAVYKPQPDVYDSNGFFFAIGRKLIFQVINPSTTFRMRVSLTDSILGHSHTALPDSAVALGRGANPSTLGFVGSGSANVYTSPLQPMHLDDRSYVALDLAREPAHFSGKEPTGLNRLYNRSVLLDPRLLNGFCRDISLITEEDYQHMPRPNALLNFPRDLVAQPGLEYSGIYEDGWISSQAFVILGAVQAGQRIVIKGMVPLLPDGSLPDNTIEVQLNGQTASTTPLPLGSFEVSCAVDLAAPRVRIDLHFSREGRLPGNDQRPIAALLTSIAIQPEN